MSLECLKLQKALEIPSCQTPLEVAVDKTKRLAAVGYEEEAWKAEMMGLQGTAQKGVIPGRGAANE